MPPSPSTNYRKYLPSKKFAKVIGAYAGLAVIFLFATRLWSSQSSFNRNGSTHLVEANGTVADLIVQDSNGNGIPDWEESLAGLDPKGDGAANKKIVDEKTAAAGTPPAADEDVSATDEVSQQLLGTLLALRQSGTLTPTSLANVAASLGDTIDAKHTNAATYAMSDMKLYASDSLSVKRTYKNDLNTIIDSYSDIDLGSEAMIIASGLQDGGDGALKELEPLAEAYAKLGKQIMGLTTPPAVAQNALDLANASAQMGAALTQAEHLYTDVISGMVGIDDYTKANDVSLNASKTLAAYFAN